MVSGPALQEDQVEVTGADPVADGQHFAGAVRARDDRIVDRNQVIPGRDHQVAVVERNGVHANAHFAQAKVAHRIVDGLQAVDVGAVKNLVSLHGCSYVS